MPFAVFIFATLRHEKTIHIYYNAILPDCQPPDEKSRNAKTLDKYFFMVYNINRKGVPIMYDSG